MIVDDFKNKLFNYLSKKTMEKRNILEYQTPILREYTALDKKEVDSIEINSKYLSCKSGPVCGPGYCPRRS